MKILVTGADGFIGSHLTETLVRLGHDVRAMVLYNSFSSWGWLDQADPEIKEALDIYPGDVRDPHAVREAVKGCDVIFNLAALVTIPHSYRAPASYIETNMTGTLNILQAARENNVQRVIQTSTSEVYGTAQFVPMTEDHPLQAQSPYAACKIGADQLALSYFRCFDFPATVIRPFNTYGPRQSERAVIPTIICQILAGVNPIQLGSLHPTRDFNYVQDIADAFVKAIDAADIDGEVINVGSGFEISVGETASIISNQLRVNIDIETQDKRIRPENSEVERLFADASKAKRLLNWESNHGGLEGFELGLSKAIEWYSDPENRAFFKHNQYNI